MNPLKSPETGPDPFEMLSKLVGQPDAKGKEKRDKLRFGIEAAPLLGIGFILLTEYLKDLSEKKKTEKKGKKERLSEQPVAKTEKPEEEEVEEETEDEPIQPKVVKKSIEIKKSNEVLVIGDSIPKGMTARFRKGEKPDFIGKVGKSTPAILNDVRANREKLNGKRVVIISCGGNDLVGTDNYEKIADNIDKIVKECEKTGIKEIIILTRFPYQSDFKRTYLKDRSRELRDVILKRFHEPRVKVVDLYKHFADEKGDLKEQYANKGKDKLHPRKAYNDALKYIASQSDADIEKLIS